MGVPSGTFQTYQSIGNREDLIDVITNIAPSKTPVLSMTGSARASAVYHEWQTDTLAAPTANKQIEGDDAAALTITPTVRTGNYCQILTKNINISETQEAIEKAGRGSEEDYQTGLKMKELATDIEYAFTINTASASGASGTARQLKGLAGWVATNITSATANRSLTASILDSLLKDVWAAGGDPDVILVGGAQKMAFMNTTNFPGLTKNVTADEKKYVAAIDVYESPFGVMKLVLSYVMNSGLANTLFALQMDKFRKAWLRPIKKKPLAATGDAKKFQIVAEVTLESLQEKASGIATQLT
jgi:hypothetical protein